MPSDTVPKRALVEMPWTARTPQPAGSQRSLFILNLGTPRHIHTSQCISGPNQGYRQDDVDCSVHQDFREEPGYFDFWQVPCRSNSKLNPHANAYPYWCSQLARKEACIREVECSHTSNTDLQTKYLPYTATGASFVRILIRLEIIISFLYLFIFIPYILNMSATMRSLRPLMRTASPAMRRLPVFAGQARTYKQPARDLMTGEVTQLPDIDVS